MIDSFGVQLQYFRVAAGLSLGALAREITYSRSYLSKIENGKKPPTPDIAKRCDRVLCTGGILAALVASPKTEAPAKTVDDEYWMLGLTGVGELSFQQLPRRPQGAPGFDVASRLTIDDQVLAALRVSFEHYRVLGTMASPAAVLGPLIAHIDVLRSLTSDPDCPHKTELLLMAARAAEYAGWMSQEAGHEPAALWWTDRAVDFAAAAGNRGFASYALVRQAEIALYRPDPLTTVELAAHAQENETGLRILGLAARCEAQGHALVGDPSRFQRALDRAAELFDRTALDEPVFGSSTVADEAALAEGWALYDLGRPAASAELLDRAMVGIAPTGRRARARFGARRALAYASQGEIDHACELAHQVLEDAIPVDSATVRADLHQLMRTLARWHNHPAVGLLKPEVTAVLQTHIPRSVT